MYLIHLTLCFYQRSEASWHQAVKLIIMKLVTNMPGLSFTYVGLKVTTDKIHSLCLSAYKLMLIKS
jgi:hypothetical protein